MAEGKLMRALVYDGYDGGVARLKHVQVPIPTPNKDEILIKMEATSLNPVDWKSYQLKLFLRPFFARNSPLIPALDIAGEVVEVGSEVKKFKPGDKVVAVLSLIRGGGLSEYGLATESLTVSRPAPVSAAQAAGLPGAGITAYAALTQFAGIKLDGTGPRKNILITAASGGVGQYAVQLAKMANTHITATCGARNIDLVKSLGADEVLDYKTPEGAALKSPSGKKYDVVVYCTSGNPWSVLESSLRENGIVVHLTPGPSVMWTIVVNKLTFAKKKLVPLLMLPKGDGTLDYLLELVKEGKLKTVIDSVHSLSEAEKAWRKGIDGHATGKIIVEA